MRSPPRRPLSHLQLFHPPELIASSGWYPSRTGPPLKNMSSARPAAFVGHKQAPGRRVPLAHRLPIGLPINQPLRLFCSGASMALLCHSYSTAAAVVYLAVRLALALASLAVPIRFTVRRVPDRLRRFLARGQSLAETPGASRRSQAPPCYCPLMLRTSAHIGDLWHLPTPHDPNSSPTPRYGSSQSPVSGP